MRLLILALLLTSTVAVAATSLTGASNPVFYETSMIAATAGRGLEVRTAQSAQTVPAEPEERAKGLQEREDKPFKQTAQYLLGSSYLNYIRIKKCVALREGYALVFISEAELEQARIAVKQIEDKLSTSDLGFDESSEPWTPEKMWDKANRLTSGDRGLTRDRCQLEYRVLIARHRTLFPDATRLQKDF